MSRNGDPDPYHGYKLRYINPATGGSPMPTIGAFMALLPGGFNTAPYRSTDGTIYSVVEGTGETIVGRHGVPLEAARPFRGAELAHAPPSRRVRSRAVQLLRPSGAGRAGLWREERCMRDVLIAGAGLGGLTAALALIQRGHRVRVFEQASELKEVGAGVQIGSNGSRLLISLGLQEAMERVVCVPLGREFRLWSTGQRWRAFDLGETSVQRFGAPYWMVHRGDFHAVLLDAVRRPIRTRSSPAMPVSVRTGCGQRHASVWRTAKPRPAMC